MKYCVLAQALFMRYNDYRGEEPLAKTKTSSAVKQRYNEKAYDRLSITIPKGRKETIETYTANEGVSVNGLVNRLLRETVGLTEEEWKKNAEK